MPTYDYQCDACGHEFEKFQKMSDDPVRICPECGKEEVRKRIGAGSGIIFKGSGFYLTDYRSDAYKKSADKDSGSSSGAKSDSGTSNSSEKTATSAEKKTTSAAG